MTKNKTVIEWIEKIKKIVNPKDVVWIDGSEAQLEALRKEACETGEIIKLNQQTQTMLQERKAEHLYVQKQKKKPDLPTTGGSHRLRTISFTA